MTFGFQSWHLAEQEIIMERPFYSLLCQWRSVLIRVRVYHQSAEAFVAFHRWNGEFSQCDCSTAAVSRDADTLIILHSDLLINSLSVNFHGISSNTNILYENTWLRTELWKRKPGYSLLLPAVSMLWFMLVQDLHFWSAAVLVRLSNPRSSLRDSACQLRSLSEKTAFAGGHRYPSELSSTADTNYRKKSWKCTRHCSFFPHFWLQQRLLAAAWEDT